MNDCPNAGMRDQLCDVVHRTLSDAECRRVEEHIAGCPDCAAEIALLQRARAVLTRAAPVIDASAIVAALPRPQRDRAVSFANWRVAATIAVIAVGAASLSLARVQSAGREAGNDSVRTAVVASADVQSLSFAGRLSALEDEDLEQLLADINQFDGALPAEPRAVLPVPTWDGGTP